MLVLLGLSTLAAAMVDTRSLRDNGTGSTIAGETETQPTTSTTATEPESRGRLLEPLAIRVGADRKVVVVPMEVGDQLPLTVRSKASDQLEIAALGLLEPVSPEAPARFDILATAPGTYGMRLVEADDVVARIEVSKPSKAKEPGPGA